MKRVNWALLLFGLIFFISGISVIIVGIAIKKSNEEFMKTAEKTEGVISNIETYTNYNRSKKRNETNHTVYVTYEVDGKTYENVRLSYYTSSMYVGKGITLYYNPQNPGNIKVEEGMTVVTVLTSVMGGIFALVGFLVMFFSFKRGSKLKKTGKRFEGQVLSIDCNTSVRVNGRNPYKVTCRVEDYSKGEAYIYKSKNVYLDLYEYNLETVPVYVDVNNPAKYFVDVEEGIKQSISQAYDNGLTIREFD